MYEKLEWFLENCRKGLCGEQPTFQWSILIICKFGEAAKISMISNDQTCHFCNVGSKIYLISCSPETTDIETLKFQFHNSTF